MAGLSAGLTLAMGLGAVTLAIQMVSVALAKALRTYSRSRLEALCALRDRPERADAIAHREERTERAAEALVVAASVTLAALLGVVADRLGSGWADDALVVAAVAVTACGYIAAGVVGRVFAESALFALWPLAAPLRALAMPLTLASGLIERLTARLAGMVDAPPRPPSVEVEIHDAVENPEDVEADLPDATRERLERVVALSRRDVSEIMTPRSRMVTLSAGVTARDAARSFRQTGLSRIPLYGENRDDIVGILYSKDLLPLMLDDDRPDSIRPRTLARIPYFVPETKVADALLDEFRARRAQIAVVVDEFGGVSGLVTLEDLIEELVGPIDDEHDVPTPDDPVRVLGDHRYEVDATLAVEDLNDRLGLRVPTDGDYQTVGGFAFSELGRLPEPGSAFRSEGAEFTVLEVADHSIKRLRVELIGGNGTGRNGA